MNQDQQHITPGIDQNCSAQLVCDSQLLPSG